jgi:tetratricopeptide (TPR) repeat protein
VAYPARRWPVVVLAVCVILAAAGGVTVGATTSTSSSSSTASSLAAEGQYAKAIAIDEAIAGRGGPLAALNPGAAGAARTAAQQTLMAWAAALGRTGRVDVAVSLYRSVTTTSLRKRALDALAALLLATATADARQGQYPNAIQRLTEIAAIAAATPAGAQAARQLPVDQVGEAGVLVTSGRAADAVALLQTVLREGSAEATRTAMNLLPAALLAAGQQALAHDSYQEALQTLQQLVSSFPSTPEAVEAGAMLHAPEVVSGTLVMHSGAPISARVRLSSNYKAEPGGMYQTTAPFYYTTADISGDFSFSGVPVGGPYVLEVLSNGNWTTLINPNTNKPANPVKVFPLVPVDLTFVVLSP